MEESLERKRPKIKIEPEHVEYLIRHQEQAEKELTVLRAESRITHGFLNLAERLSRREQMVGEGYPPLRVAKKAFEAALYELEKETSQS